MKITYFKGKHPNFGDDLNLWLWPRLLPDFFDDNDKTVFLGIGSIIGANLYRDDARKIVFGSAFVPEYHKRPLAIDSKWDIYFVRGPRTAEMLGISPKLSLGDPAILLRTLPAPPQPSPSLLSFMPHWESLDRGNWPEACRLAGVNLIDPRADVEVVLGQLRQTKLLMTESLHGAVVADALRVPWIALLPLNARHRGKWADWAQSLGIDLRHHRLCPSSLLETRLSVLRKPITGSPLSARLQKNLTHAAAHRLVRLARVSPQLSDERKLDSITASMLEKVAQLRKDFGAHQDVKTPAGVMI